VSFLKVVWTLVYWEEEMSMSVHPEGELIDVQCIEEGAQCKVRFGRDIYDGVIAATGSYNINKVAGVYHSVALLRIL